MRREEQIGNFKTNLRILCEGAGSISEACRRLGISRTQINKYLAGVHSPSPRNIERISKHFGVEESDMFLTPNQFTSKTNAVDFNVLKSLRNSQRFAQFGIQQSTAIKNIAEYYGVYDRYHFSSIYPGRILRSVLCIFPRDGIPHHVYIERFPSYDDPNINDYTFKYYGLCTMLGERLILCDFETIQKNEMTFTVVSTSHRNTIKFLYGVTTGIAATLHREPFSTRVAFHYRGSGRITRKHLKQARTLHPDDTSVPFEIRQHLGVQGSIIRGS